MRTFHHAWHYEAEDWIRLGWIPRPHILFGTHHGNRSVMMEWLECECGRQLVKPKRGGPAE